MENQLQFFIYMDVKHGLYLNKLMMAQRTAVVSEYKSSTTNKYISQPFFPTMQPAQIENITIPPLPIKNKIVQTGRFYVYIATSVD